jgi:hypothetical protein
MNGTWLRYDTGAGLYAALPGKCSFFSDEHLDRYDHIYGGTHLDWLLNSYDQESREMMTRIHSLAKTGNIDALKGIRREQDGAFRMNFPDITHSMERRFSDEEAGRGTGKEAVRDAQGAGVI